MEVAATGPVTQGIQILSDESYRGSPAMRYDQTPTMDSATLNAVTQAVTTNMLRNARSQGVVLGSYAGGNRQTSTTMNYNAIPR